MGRKQLSLNEDIDALLDEWAAESTNNNTTRLVEDLTELADEATEATGKDDPREALERLLNDYSGYDRSAGYDPDKSEVTLTREDVAELTAENPVPALNPDHVPRSDIKNMGTWEKAGMIAGFMRFKHDNSPWSEVKNQFKPLRMKWCGGRSRLDSDMVRMRYEDSVPDVEQVLWDSPVDAVSEWMQPVTAWVDSDNPPFGREKLVEYEEVGKELVAALENDGREDRAEEVDGVREELTAVIADIDKQNAGI